MTKKSDQLKNRWQKEASLKMHGWDFSHLKGRWVQEGLPWDYAKTVLKYLKPSDRLLDMATGGGELLLSFKHTYCLTAVTESWSPNIKLLQKKLSPKGIQVYPTGSEAGLPVEDDSLDIILNSHGDFNLPLIYRKLHAGGLFISEQVGVVNNFSLSQYLDPKYLPAFPDNTLLNTLTKLEENGFQILKAQQAFPVLKFLDVGAIVYYASVIPWEFPKFSVKDSFEALCGLQKLIEKQKYVLTYEDRFLVVGRKP